MFDHCLVKYPDLVWCFYNDFRRALVFLNDANDVHPFTRIEELWRHFKLREVTSKDHSSEVAVVLAEVEETHNS